MGMAANMSGRSRSNLGRRSSTATRRVHPRPLYSDGCRTTNRVTTHLPSGPRCRVRLQPQLLLESLGGHPRPVLLHLRAARCPLDAVQPKQHLCRAPQERRVARRTRLREGLNRDAERDRRARRLSARAVAERRVRSHSVAALRAVLGLDRRRRSSTRASRCRCKSDAAPNQGGILLGAGCAGEVLWLHRSLPSF